MSENVKKPIQKGKVKVPVVMQLEETECGAASLCMVLAYYNKWIPIEEVRGMCGVSRDGSTAGNIMRAARYYGLSAAGFRISTDALAEKCSFPCIAFINRSHFVVLCGVKKGYVFVIDHGMGNC